MDAAFELVRSGPPSRTFVLARENGARAGDAADRRIARVVQRVVRNLVHVDVCLHALRVPVHDGLDLPDAVALRPLDTLCIGSERYGVWKIQPVVDWGRSEEHTSELPSLRHLLCPLLLLKKKNK